MGPFAHPLFTTMTRYRVYFALQQRSAVAKAGYILLGYAGAVLARAVERLVADEHRGLLLVYLRGWCRFRPAIVLAVHSRRREQRIVAEKLPGMVAAASSPRTRPTWLGSLPTGSRRSARQAGSGESPSQGRQELRRPGGRIAYVRDRIDRGFGDERVFRAAERGGVLVHMARAAAPTLPSLAGYRAPGSSWRPAGTALPQQREGSSSTSGR